MITHSKGGVIFSLAYQQGQSKYNNTMTYQVIFTNGYEHDDESLMKGYRKDVMIKDNDDHYYEVNFIELEVIKNGFHKDSVCYLENNIVILHEVTKDNILRSIPELHKWLFSKRWIPLTINQVERYYYPNNNWKVFEVLVSPL
ncbi:hypothetical protein [Lacibacter sp. H407]|uniref:hypothetical protein n=1 Tax=Lacibacter sp. H407 TaxID=3133423 RepID=UPI0030BBBDFA